MINYLYDCYSILNKVYSQKTYIKQAINGTIIEEKNRSLTIKTCYGVLDKDIELSYYIDCLTEKKPKLVIRTILKISMYAIKYLDKKGCKIEIRIPFVPGYNSEQIEKAGAFLKKLGGVVGVRILPYHNYATSKYKSLDIKDTLPGELPTKEQIKEAKNIITAFGLKALE